MVWMLLLVVYHAPDNATNWNGPWTFGTPFLDDKQYQSEADCRNAAIQKIGRIHQGMLAPIRYRCVSVPAELQRDASR